MNQMEDAFAQLNNKLIDDILQYVSEQDPKFFEKLVVDLLVAMGYGGDFEDAAKVTQFSNDGGIDGIIKEDALGLDKVYLQAKRWKETNVVGRQIFINLWEHLWQSEHLKAYISQLPVSQKPQLMSLHPTRV